MDYNEFKNRSNGLTERVTQLIMELRLESPGVIIEAMDLYAVKRNEYFYNYLSEQNDSYSFIELQEKCDEYALDCIREKYLKKK